MGFNNSNKNPNIHGDKPADQFVDVPPYLNEPHLKLQLVEFVKVSRPDYS
jgi:hypothetical protein